MTQYQMEYPLDLTIIKNEGYIIKEYLEYKMSVFYTDQTNTPHLNKNFIISDGVLLCIICKNAVLFYKKNKQNNFVLHRDNGQPTIFKKTKYGIAKHWLVNGKYHNDTGPSLHIPLEHNKFIECWDQNGKWHREDGPAITDTFGQHWYNNHKRHRLDGPAVIKINGDKEYWIDGEKISKEEFLKKERHDKI